MLERRKRHLQYLVAIALAIGAICWVTMMAVATTAVTVLPRFVVGVGGSVSLAERLMVRRLQRRTLQLIKGDLADAQHWQLQPDPQPDWPCSMAHRDVLIAIHPAHGSAPVLYSLGSAPSGIWRGQVMMRCGPAFDLQGRPRASSTYQNRVVLDAIETIKLHQPLGLPVIEMEWSSCSTAAATTTALKPFVRRLLVEGLLAIRLRLQASAGSGPSRK